MPKPPTIASHPRRADRPRIGGPTARGGPDGAPAPGANADHPEAEQPAPAEGADLRPEEQLFDHLTFQIAAFYPLQLAGQHAADASTEAMKSRLDAHIAACDGLKPKVFTNYLNRGVVDVRGTMTVWKRVERQLLAFPVLLNLKLSFHEDGWLIVVPGSKVSLNGMKCLAIRLGIGQSTNLSLDENTNHLGRPASQIPDGRQDFQLDLLQEILAGALALVDDLAKAAAGGALDPPGGSFELSTAEICADVEVSDAQRLMRFAASGWQFGMVERCARQFRGSWKGTTMRALSAPSIHFAPDASGVRAKAYAKRPDCIRLEVAASRLSAVRGVMDGTEVSKDLCAASAREQLRTFAEMAKPLAERQFDFLERVSRSGRVSPAALVIALLVLIDLARGLRTGKRGAPPSHATMREAAKAFDELVTGAGYKLSSDAAKGVLRRVLDSLCKGGTLQRHPLYLHYSVSADFANANMEFASAARPVVPCLAAKPGDQGCGGGTSHVEVQETPATSMAPDESPAEPDAPLTLDSL
jgi:hypothetical protein